MVKIDHKKCKNVLSKNTKSSVRIHCFVDIFYLLDVSVCFASLTFLLSPDQNRTGGEGETGDGCNVQAGPRRQRQRKAHQSSAQPDWDPGLSVRLEGWLPAQQHPPQEVQSKKKTCVYVCEPHIEPLLIKLSSYGLWKSTSKMIFVHEKKLTSLQI